MTLLVKAGVNQLNITRRIAGRLERQRQAHLAGKMRRFARHQPRQPNGVVGARFATGHQQNFLIGQRGDADFPAERIERTGAGVHPLIAVIDKLI